MFGKRDFLEDSSSSFETDQPGTPPPVYQNEVLKSHLDQEFELDDKQNPNVYPDRNRGITVPAPFQPVKKEVNEKVGFVNFFDETSEEIPERPATNMRPGSSSAQMRAKMLEAQKNKLMSRPAGNMTVQSSNFLNNTKTGSPLDNLIYSNNVITEKEISGNKTLKAFNTGGVNYEPSVVRSQGEYIPGPIKSEVTVIKSDDIDEEKLEETSAIRNPPSKNLQDLHRQIEESKKVPKVVEIYAERPKNEERFKAEEVKPEEKAKIEENPVAKYQPVKPLNLKEEKTKGEPIDDKRSDSKEETKDTRPIVRQPAINVRDIIANEMRDMKKFLTSPMIRGITLQCTIRRDKSGFNRLFPKYYMSISEGLIFLLAAKKRGGSRTSNYMVTTNQKDFNTKSSSFVGKVRSNFLGTEFMIYDNGLNPKRKGANPNNVRSEIGVALYVFFIQESNIMGSKGPRKMRVLTAAINANNEPAI